MDSVPNAVPGLFLLCSLSTLWCLRVVLYESIYHKMISLGPLVTDGISWRHINIWVSAGHILFHLWIWYEVFKPEVSKKSGVRWCLLSNSLRSLDFEHMDTLLKEFHYYLLISTPKLCIELCSSTSILIGRCDPFINFRIHLFPSVQIFRTRWFSVTYNIASCLFGSPF